MKLSELKLHLRNHPEKQLRFALPTGSWIPIQAHVTEVARIEKRFIDCGGTLRNDLICRLQTWVADDTDHRLTAGKLLQVLDKAVTVLETEDIEVEIEHEAPYVSQFPVNTAEVEGQTLSLRLGTKHTACLAEDRCQRPANLSQFISFKPLPMLK